MPDREQKQSTIKDGDYERIGRLMQPVIESGYINKRRLVQLSLLRGAAFGVGSVIGGTILLAIVLWVLNLSEEIPIIGDLSQKLSESVQEAK